VAKTNVLSAGTHKGIEWWTIANMLGFRCGYVLVPAGHPWHGRSYSEIGADVHGGLTYSVAEGADWAIGFDCAHAYDAPDPALGKTSWWKDFSDGKAVIRDQAYVDAECIRLAEQVAEYV